MLNPCNPRNFSKLDIHPNPNPRFGQTAKQGIEVNFGVILVDEVHRRVEDEEEGPLHQETVAVAGEELFFLRGFRFLFQEEAGCDVGEIESRVQDEDILKCLVTRN